MGADSTQWGTLPRDQTAGGRGGTWADGISRTRSRDAEPSETSTQAA
jgi:hypothetical protein